MNFNQKDLNMAETVQFLHRFLVSLTVMDFIVHLCVPEQSLLKNKMVVLSICYYVQKVMMH
jgi:hypothetical protein